MRIAIVNWSTRRVGGVETYLNTIIPELARAGHEIAFWSEVDQPLERARIELPVSAPAWCVAESGAEQALASLSAWQPDVIYAHKLADPDLELRVLGIAPSVFFAHDYNGTCISGTKTFRFPVVQPCSRRFGWQCLVHYFPHRCGGLSPVTMFKLYGLQTRRQENLHRYDAIVTHSDHMLAELIKHGLSPRRAYNFPYYVQPADSNGTPPPDSLPPAVAYGIAQTFAAETSAAPPLALGESWGEGWGEGLGSDPQDPHPQLFSQREKGVVIPRHVQNPRREVSTTRELQLLFSGRMEYLKGGHVFIAALPEVAAALDRRLHVTFAGDGRQRSALERQAAHVRSEKLEINFPGWVDRSRIEALLKNCDLLVVPSLWPEPFGLVGPEAGHYGVPVAAFNVGGIHDWLLDGVNGFLASGNPPTAAGLAAAIIKCLQDPIVHAGLRVGAAKVSRQFNIENHLTALLDVFRNVVRQK